MKASRLQEPTLEDQAIVGAVEVKKKGSGRLVEPEAQDVTWSDGDCFGYLVSDTIFDYKKTSASLFLVLPGAVANINTLLIILLILCNPNPHTAFLPVCHHLKS